ncbi:MAG: hypothetical protein AB8G23_18890 [Myxococcota bacterium]
MLMLSATLMTSAASAFIPDAKRTMREISRVNRSSGRTQALQIDVTMRIGERDPIAAGQLITHPTGLARLELRGYSGRIDRYVLSGSELSGAKDGERLGDPQPLLQPLFLLQPSSETTLRTALATFGVDTSLVGLAPCGEQDCFVFGDPRLALRSSRSGRGNEEEGFLGGPPLSGSALGSAFESAFGSESGGVARFWVDTKDLQVRRVDRDNGVFMLLGPMVSFSKIMVPEWVEIHEPGAEPVRFDVERAVQVNAPPTAFSQQWLLGLPADYAPTASPGALQP